MRTSIFPLLALLSVLGVQQVLSFDDGFDFDARAVGGAIGFEDELTARDSFYDIEDLDLRDFYDEDELLFRSYDEDDLYSRQVNSPDQALTPDAIKKELDDVKEDKIGTVDAARILPAITLYRKARILSARIAKNPKRYKFPNRWRKLLKKAMVVWRQGIIYDGFKGSSQMGAESLRYTPPKALLTAIKKIYLAPGDMMKDLEAVRNYRKAYLIKGRWMGLSGSTDYPAQKKAGAEQRGKDWIALMERYEREFLRHSL
ncbi:hypothetical protein FA15DRAFT_163215 [Coprinopsis marcescibilis]|uniref:Uncharacterized protein n=1 Tax=Coprinopsis marcescibilis TaxID=230819 RepID=A0A5C3KHR4_COPMA|nr:hypothetical protein FA15DRAFT_163215 [Coprinopsis marcescibilis]